jgi:cysteine desulfurase
MRRLFRLRCTGETAFLCTDLETDEEPIGHRPAEAAGVVAHRFVARSISVGAVDRLTPSHGRYLDAASGIPLHPAALEAMAAAQVDGWADPSRLTSASRRSAVLLDAARAAVAQALSVQPDEVNFLPSATQALHHAILGTLAGRRRVGNRLVISAVEHSAVFKAADWHRAHGGLVDEMGVDSLGRVDIDAFVAAAAEPSVAAAVLQAANHEVGTRQPVAEIAQRIAELGVPLIVDATHDLVYGDAPVGVPVFTADARLWGGPAGVGILVIRRGTRWTPPFPVDESEFGHGAGAVDVPAIVGAAASLHATRSARSIHAERLSAQIGLIRQRVPELVPDTVVLGDANDRLPHLVTFSSLYVEGEALLTELDRHGFAVSSGSSCTSDTLTPSHVLVAMGALTSGNVRVSLHPGVTAADVQDFLAILPEAVNAVRAHFPLVDIAVLDGDTARDASTATRSTVDSRGRRCPLPILDLARALPAVQVGTDVVVLADDPAAASDIAAWCRMRGHTLVNSADHGDGATAYRVRRRH